MASVNPYPSGNNAIAPLPLFTPDFGAIGTLLQRRSAMYEQGFNQIKAANDSIVNAPLTNQNNEVLRTQYLQQAQQRLKDISSMDLSEGRNVDEAQSVFAPFWQDKFMLKDMAYTKQAQSEISKAFAARDSTDEKIRATYSDTAIQYIQNGLDPLRTANRTEEDFAKVQQRRFIRAQNIAGDMEKLRKEYGFEIQTVDASGPQIVTTTNGVKSIQSYKNFLQANWKAEYDDYLRMEMTVAHERSVKEKMGQFGVSEIEAKQMIGKEYLKDTKETYQNGTKELTANIASIDSQIEELKKTTATPNNYSAIIQKVKDLEQTKVQYSKQIDEYKERLTDIDKNYESNLKGVTANGPVYFTQYGKMKKINDIANALASNIKQDVKKNDAYFASDDLRVKLEDLDLKKAQFEFTKAVARGEYPFSGTGKAILGVGPDGSPQISFGGGGNDGVLNGQDTTPEGKGKTQFDTPMVGGINTQAQLTKANAYEVYVDDVTKQRYSAYNSIFSAIEKDSDLQGILPADFLKSLRAADGVSPASGKTKYKDEVFTKLKEKGIIPVDAKYDYASGPTRVVNAITSWMYNKYSEKYRSGKATDNEIDIYTELEQSRDAINEWGQQNKEQKDLTAKALANNKYAPIRTGTAGNYKVLDSESLSDIASKRYGMKSTGDIPLKDIMSGYLNGTVTIKSFDAVYDEAGGGYMIRPERTYAVIKGTDKEVDLGGKGKEFLEKYKQSTIAPLYKGIQAEIVPQAKYYIDHMGKVGMETIYTSDGKRDTLDKGQNLVTEALSGSNFAQKDGNGGVGNMDDLVANGGNKEKILAFFNATMQDAGNALGKVRYTTIGKNGNPSVIINYKQELLKEESKSGSGFLDEASVSAIGRLGIEINLADGIRLKNAPSVQEAGYISKVLTQGQILKSNQFDEEAGFRYIIKQNSKGDGVAIKIDKKVLSQATTPDGKPIIAGENQFVEGSWQNISYAQMAPEELYQHIQQLKIQTYKQLRNFRTAAAPKQQSNVTIGDLLNNQ
jgi:hypothetical protein